MTPRDQAITNHLAERVCGFPRDEFWRAHGFCMVDGRVFDPITDPRDCAIVMEAWRAQKGRLLIKLGLKENFVSARQDDRVSIVKVLDLCESWTEAVCESIGKASGFEWEEK